MSFCKKGRIYLENGRSKTQKDFPATFSTRDFANVKKGGFMAGKTDAAKSWSPYLGGGLTGLLMVLSVWLSGEYFGVSTTFVRTTGLVETLISPERLAKMEYFLKVAPKIDWQWMFVVGIFLGSLISALASGTFRWQSVPDTWEKRFGKTPVVRSMVAFAGGAIAMWGARLADG
jgi:hypothetical protein